MVTVKTNAQRIKISIIEDDKLIREGYSFLMNEREGFDVISTYSSAEQALSGLVRDQPDLVLLDIGLPGKNGIDAISRIRQLLPAVYILILTVYESEEMIFSALTQGASGYLTKNCSSEKILNSISEIMTGGGSMTPNVARLVIKSFQRNESSPLSKRETQILEETANGKSRGKIASELFIDYETVKSHLKNIYAKLNVHSRADAIKTARENRLI